MTRKTPAKPNVKERRLAKEIAETFVRQSGPYHLGSCIDWVASLLASARCGKGGRKGKGRA